MAYFCPKRFNRYPRFTIFFKKGGPGGAPGGAPENESNYVNENTVSLNADFLKFLSDKKNVNLDLSEGGGGDDSKTNTTAYFHNTLTTLHP